MTYFRMSDSHYHRRGAVSLLSSGWDQVVPTRYGRQEHKLVLLCLLGFPQLNTCWGQPNLHTLNLEE
jgi:hypothetical protein